MRFSVLFLFLFFPFNGFIFGQSEDGLSFVLPKKVGMDAKKLNRVDQKMEELIKEGRLAGGIVVVARKGKVVHFGTYGKRDLENDLPIKRDTIFRIYSMTKSITSVAALMLNEEGKLSLDDPLSQYFPPLKKMKVLEKGKLVEMVREVTIADLLRHTSGLTYGRTPHKEINQAHKDAGVLDRDKKLVPMINGMNKVPLLFQPGSDWVYGCSTDVLGGVVEVASGMPLDQFLQERIFKPLKMEDTGFYVPPSKADRFSANYNYRGGKLSLKDDSKTSKYLEDPAFKSGGGGLCSTAPDYMRFLLMIENGGTGTDFPYG